MAFPNLSISLAQVRRWGLQPWSLLVLAIALLLSLPVWAVLSSLLTPASDTWKHLANTVLLSYIRNSLLLVLGVGVGVLTIGVGTAWLTTLCRFPGQGWFSWALLLPLAAPAYLLAYIYTDWLSEIGPVQGVLRAWTGWSYGDYWFPEIRSLPGAIALLTLVLYPYVYLLARAAFLEQAAATLEASRSLGSGPWRSFLRVALPLARPSVMAGLALALMETLADFGTVDYFGISTFTTGIYRTWLNLGERITAMQLATALLLAVLWLALLERWSRGQAGYYQTTSRYQTIVLYQLSGWRAGLAIVSCGLPIVLGFVIPATLLGIMTWQNPDQDAEFWTYARHSLILAGITAVIAVGIALVMAYGRRLQPTISMQLATTIAVMGYTIPGSVIAVGIMVPLGRVDNALATWLKTSFNLDVGLLLSGTIVALVFAYLVRFLAVAFNTVEASLGKIQPSLDEAARSLGYQSGGILHQIHLPLLRGSVLTAALLVFVDVMKELPATLIIRPFNFDTLAVRTYQLASDERLVESAAAALAIVGVGLVPVLLLSWQIGRSRQLR